MTSKICTSTPPADRHRGSVVQLLELAKPPMIVSSPREPQHLDLHLHHHHRMATANAADAYSEVLDRDSILDTLYSDSTTAELVRGAEEIIPSWIDDPLFEYKEPTVQVVKTGVLLQSLLGQASKDFVPGLGNAVTGERHTASLIVVAGRQDASTARGTFPSSLGSSVRPGSPRAAVACADQLDVMLGSICATVRSRRKRSPASTDAGSRNGRPSRSRRRASHATGLSPASTVA